MKRTHVALIVVGGTVLGSEAVWQLLKLIRNRWIKFLAAKAAADRAKPFATVMFFKEQFADCRAHLDTDKTCSRPDCPVGYLRQMENQLDKAMTSVHACMYFLTCKPLGDGLIRAHKRGVSVKIILDPHLTDASLAQALEFYKAGIPVRVRELVNLMHHKFVVIDGDTVITGSLNWTMNALFGNYENVLMTNHADVVRPYAVEFEELWLAFAGPFDLECMAEGSNSARNIPTEH